MGEKKSFLEKLGIISTVPTPGTGKIIKKDNFPNSAVSYAPPLGVDMQQDSGTGIEIETPDIILAAYSKLPASKYDIFLVEKLLSNFATLPEETKNATLQATLTTMGIDINLFISEAQTRSNAINNALAAYSEKTAIAIANIAQKIVDAKEQIELLSEQSVGYQNNLSLAKSSTKGEVDRLQNILKVLGGGN